MIECIKNDVCYLPIIGNIFEEVGKHFISILDIRLNTSVIEIGKDYVKTNSYSLDVNKVICINGGSQIVENDFLSSTKLLTNNFVLLPEKDVVILGGSHTAWSVAWKLLINKFKRKIIIYSRHNTRIFCQDDDEAKRIGFKNYDENDKCPVTRQIFRFAGLRGDAKSLWMNKEQYNIIITNQIPIGDFTFIQAYGYKANYIQGIENATRFGFMSNAYEPSGEKSFTKSKDGIWIYGHTMGELFVKHHFSEFLE